MKLIEVLINIGLNTKEAQVYLATLELGEAPASAIAHKAKLNRVTTYDILKKLVKRGFISTYIKAQTSMFSATDPELIQGDLQKRYRDFQTHLPELNRLHGKSGHPKIRYYEGTQGVQKIYADTLTSKTEILNYADSRSIREFWPSYDQDYVDERVKRGIYLRGIAPLDEYGKKVMRENASHHREIRLVNKGPFSFSNEINIYDDKVAIISYGKNELIGMIIESSEVANTQRAIFMMAWEFAGQQKQY